jgi:hypothetical protein
MLLCAITTCFNSTEAATVELLANSKLPAGLAWGPSVSSVQLALQIGNISQESGTRGSLQITAYLSNSGNTHIHVPDTLGELQGIFVYFRNDQGKLVRHSVVDLQYRLGYPKEVPAFIILR